MNGLFIQIKGLKDEKLVRPVQLIAGLFFEETVITEKTSDAVMLFTMTDTKAILKLTIFGQVYKASRKISELPSEEKERRKVVKNAISHIVLDVLTQHTGIKKNWGILAGTVRQNVCINKNKSTQDLKKQGSF